MSNRHKSACDNVRELEGPKWDFLRERQLKPHEVCLVDESILRYFVGSYIRIIDKMKHNFDRRMSGVDE